MSGALRKFLIVLAVTAASLLPQGAAWAWHEAGHMTVAAVAYRQLDPDTRKEVALLLRQHPHFGSKWKPGVAGSGVEPDLYLFMQAAMWPDVIRGDPKYDQPEWHYINRVYSPDGTAFQPGQKQNVLTALERCKLRFAAPTTRPGDRAIALCWIFHLLGDLHQPFHAVTRVTAGAPNGDRGGNDSWVHTASGPQNLHQVWDGLLEDVRRPRAVDELAARLMRERPLMELAERDTRTAAGWVEESLRLSVAAGYHHSPADRPYERIPLTIGKNRESAKPLPEGYLVNARSNAERRVTLAGYRLAGVLAGFYYGGS